LPFAGAFVWLVRKILPPQSGETKTQLQTKYIDAAFLPTPDIALDQAKLEIGRVGRRVCNMLNMLPPLAPGCKKRQEVLAVRDKLKEIEAIEEEVDQLHGAILSYLGQLRKEPLSDQQSARQIKLISISPEMRKTLDTVQEKVNHTLLDAVNSVRRSDAA